MAGKANITYFHHSGFTAAVKDTLLVFDYWRGDVNPLPVQDEMRPQDFKPFKKVLVFVSHDHEDHFDEIIYTWEKFGVPIRYIVSYDFPEGKKGERMRPGDVLFDGDTEIQAFGSTDKGVSFLVKIDGLNIFHAGDLNLWHWREESTLREITRAEEEFYDVMETLYNIPMDVAFFPVDPRMGGLFDAGANHFIMSMKPRVFIPMHWQGRAEVAVNFARRARTKYTETLALTHPREQVEITFDQDQLTIRTFFAPKEEENEDVEVKLDVLSPVDPFSDSDLPVSLNEENPQSQQN